MKMAYYRTRRRYAYRYKTRSGRRPSYRYRSYRRY